MTHVLGAHSRRELEGVHPELIRVVEIAIILSEVDFTVHDGLRTAKEQLKLLKAGVSTVTKSRHMVQPDGYGHAVDLVPYIGGRLRWEWPPIYKIAEAVREAARQRGVELVWGGCWQRFVNKDTPPEEMMRRYVTRRSEAGKRVFADGPHYELRMS